MLDRLLDFGGLVLPIIFGIILLVVLITVCWKKVPQDKAAVVTGFTKRIITGKAGLVFPFFERIDIVSLENIPIMFTTEDVMDCEGVPITTTGTAVVKIINNPENIYKAVEQFDSASLTKTVDNIRTTVTDVIEGNLREIIATMSVEEIYKNRDMFSSKCEDVAEDVLGRMGLQIVVLTIKDIDDKNGFLKALGARKIAEVKKDATIAEAEANKEADIKTAESRRLGEQAKIEAQVKIEESRKDQAVKVASYKQEQDTKTAEADLAYKIQQETTRKMVIDKEKDAEILEQLRATELAKQRALRKEIELQETVLKPAEAAKLQRQLEADAQKYEEIAKAEAKAEARRKEGAANAEVIKETGAAEAEAIRSKGLAEAESLQKQAEAYQQFNQAAMLSKVVEKLPEMAAAIAGPLSNIDKVIVMDSGNGEGTTSMAGNVTKVLTQTIESVKEMTGFDLTDILKSQTYDAKVNKNLSISAESAQAIRDILSADTKSEVKQEEMKPEVKEVIVPENKPVKKEKNAWE